MVRYQGGGWWGGVGGGGCIVIAEFCMEGLHFLHANIVGRTQLELVHRGGWVEVDMPLRVVRKALQKTASWDVYRATWVM